MKQSLLVYFVCLIIISAIPFSGCSPSGAGQVDPLEGAWQMTSNFRVAADGTRTPLKPQENLFIFSDGYYSIAYALGDQPFPDYATKFSATDEEKAARMSSITVNTGTYTVSGSKMTLRPLFALVPEFVGGSAEVDYEVSGDVLTIQWRRVLSKEGLENPNLSQGNWSERTLVRLK